MEEGRILEKGRGRERYISDGRRETGIKGKGGGKDKRNGEGRVEDNRKGGRGEDDMYQLYRASDAFP